MTDKKPKPTWDRAIGHVLVAFALALLVLWLFESVPGAVCVFAVVMLCRSWRDAKFMALALLAVVAFRTAVVEPFNIPSGSMKSNLLIGDYLFVSKYAYGYSRYSIPFGLPLFSGRVLEFQHPQRGDVVVFRPPGALKTDYIKRIMGLPGDRIQVIGGMVYINDKMLMRRADGSFFDKDPPAHDIPRYTEMLPEGKQITILKERSGGFANNTVEYVVPAGHYFMMGDNRDNSRDSRFDDPVGFVPEENIVGRAEIIFLSLDVEGHTLRWERFLQVIQ
jgi:signal peptidase I